MLRLFLLATIALCLLPACPDTEPVCDPGYMLVDDGTRCVAIDSGAGDAGDAGDASDGDVDAADTAVDAGPCGMPCEGTTPFCNETLMTCVQCLMDSDCTDPGAAKCGSDGMCTSCDDSAQCGGIGGTDICETSGPLTGMCVECSEATEAADCAGFACDWRDGTCSTVMRMADACDDCTTDLDCLNGRRCVDHIFMGSSVGTFCFFDSADGGCGDTDMARRPYSHFVSADQH